MSSQPLLQLDNIHKSFYGAEVLHGVNLDLCPGEVLGLVGENGAGKSTLMSILGGVYGFDSGTMRLGGEVYTPATPNDATRAGIAFIRQEFSLFSNLTVAENLFVDRFPRRGLSVDNKKMEERAQVYIDLFRLDISPRTRVESLPMGVRQIVEISKALEKDAKIIIFDEPTTSLSPKEKEELFEVIGGLKARGVSIIYISHILEDVMRLCDRTTVLRDGNSVGTFQNSALDKREIIRLMVGREMNQVYPTIEKEIGEPIYEVREFVRSGSRSPVSLEIRSGEIVGMFGLILGMVGLRENQRVLNQNGVSRRSAFLADVAALAVAALLVAVGVSVIMGIYRAVLGSGSHLLITDLYQLIYEPAPAGNGVGALARGAVLSTVVGWMLAALGQLCSALYWRLNKFWTILISVAVPLALLFGSAPLLTWLDTTSAGQAAVEALAAFGRFLAASPWNAAAVLLAMGAAFFAVTWLLLRRAMIRPAK